MESKYYSFTSFKIEKWWMWPLFQLHGMMVTLQVNKTPGLVDMKVWSYKMITFYTFTVWEEKSHMLNFRNKKAHLRAMKHHGKIGSPASVSWSATHEPTRDECFKRLQAVNPVAKRSLQY